MKGISPVVAVVLLIAIAVIAAVAVWYWVSPLTGKPATASTTQIGLSVEQCIVDGVGNTTQIRIRNNGGIAVTNKQFAIYSQTGQDTTFFVTVTANSGEAKWVTTTGNLNTSTPYYLTTTGVPDIPFNCV